MRRIVNILLWVFAVLTVSDLSAQSDDKSQGTHHIEQLAQSVRALGNYAVRFTIVSGDYSSTGEYTVGGEEYHLLFAQYEAFGDAKLRYEVDHSRREVVIDKVLEESYNLLTNPSTAFDSLGEAFSVQSVERNGEGVVLLLEPKHKAAQSVVISLTLDVKTHLPKSIIYNPSGESIRIDINNIAKSNTAPKRYQAAAFNGYEMIDFR